MRERSARAEFTTAARVSLDRVIEALPAFPIDPTVTAGSQSLDGFADDSRRSLRTLHSAMTLTRIACLALLSSACNIVAAQTLYVEDKLVLNVYAEPHQGSDRVATIETGDSVEQVERTDSHVHVRLPDGREGWVGASYLSAEPPALLRLKQLQAEGGAAVPSKPASDEITKLQKQNATLQAELSELKKRQAVSAATPSAVPAVATLTPAVHEANEALPVRSETPPPPRTHARSYWWLWTVAIAVAGLLGFSAGYQTLGRRVRARFGGVKVY